MSEAGGLVERVAKRLCRRGKRHWAKDPDPDDVGGPRHVCSGVGDPCDWGLFHARAILLEVADAVEERSPIELYHAYDVIKFLREQAAEGRDE